MQMDKDKSCSRCELDRLPPEMTRFIFRKLSTEDLLQASATTDRLYRVAQHHMYLSDGALLVRSGQDTAATIAEAFDVRNVSSLYLADVRDFDRDVPRRMYRRDGHVNNANGDNRAGGNSGTGIIADGTLDVLHVGYARDVRYTDLATDGVRRLLSGVRTRRVCFGNVTMTANDVADVMSALLESGSCDNAPLALRCSYDRADDAETLRLLEMVECTCAGLLAEFRVTVRRPAPRVYAIYPTSCCVTNADDDNDAAANETVPPVSVELPEDLLAFTAFDCSGLTSSAYKRLAFECRRLRRLCMKAARRMDDDGFEAIAAMPSLQHLDIDGLSNVTSDGLLKGLELANGLQSLSLRECPYITDDVLRRVGELRRLRLLRLDLTECDKTTASGVQGMLSGCDRLCELHLTLPLNADYVDAVSCAASLDRLRVFRLTFERLSFQEHLDNQPADDDWQQTLVASFDGTVDFHVRQTFTKIAVSVD